MLKDRWNTGGFFFLRASASHRRTIFVFEEQAT